MRFFGRTATAVEGSDEKEGLTYQQLVELSKEFASHVPVHTFTTAELQGFLLLCKKEPKVALSTIQQWVAEQLAERKEKEEREEERKKKNKEKRDQMNNNQMAMGGLGGLAAMYGGLGLNSPLLTATATDNTQPGLYDGHSDDNPDTGGRR
jgi:hypothetical protein